MPYYQTRIGRNLPLKHWCKMRILVTGGAGFIGSSLVRYLCAKEGVQVLNYDKLTYAGNLSSLAEIENLPNYQFVHGDIGDFGKTCATIDAFNPQFIFNLAAETHVDRSIDSAKPFIDTNINGTFALLEAARKYFNNLDKNSRENFRFLHISTDEVYGALGVDGLFKEDTPYDPSSPYSASKAASDHLVMAWYRTYNLPVIITNCSNNYGPRQFPEKLIPLNLLNALEGKAIKIYGEGLQIRDWLYVDDHARALFEIIQKGKIGEKYNVGGNNERTNLQVAQIMCGILDEKFPTNAPHDRLIQFVAERPGHDFRYAIDAHKLITQINWQPRENFESGLRKTIEWYLDNENWWKPIRAVNYAGERLGQIVL